MPTSDELFGKYTEFADKLQRDLVAIHGQARAGRLFTRMNRAEFQEFCDSASSDPLKQRWIRMILDGYADALGRTREAA